MKIFTNYSKMVRNAIEYGLNRANTKTLGNVIFTFKIPKKHGGLLVFPKTRLGLKTYTSYTLAEAAWYMSRDRRVDWISKYGPIWNDMKDPQGLVNSNYGYQLYTNNDLTRKLELNKPVYYNIINYENSVSVYDVPCNNFVVAELRNDGLHMYSLARSIDLIYGLPFDMIALQAFGYKLLQQQNINSYVSAVTFEIIDAHVYDDMIPKLDVSYTSNQFAGIRFKDTDYYEHQEHYRDIDYRELAKEIVTYDVDIEEEIDFDTLDYFDVKERPYKAENSYLHNNLYSNPNNRKDIKLVDNDTIMYNTIGFRTLIYKKEK